MLVKLSISSGPFPGPCAGAEIVWAVSSWKPSNVNGDDGELGGLDDVEEDIVAIIMSLLKADTTGQKSD